MKTFIDFILEYEFKERTRRKKIFRVLAFMVKRGRHAEKEKQKEKASERNNELDEGGFTGLYLPEGKSFTIKALLFAIFILFSGIEIFFYDWVR